MKLLTWILGLSLIANAVLAGFCLKDQTTAKSETSGAIETIGQKASGNPASAVPTENSGIGKRELPGPKVQPTTWKDIQSADLKEFVRRLRAAGCPDQTVRDIVWAEISRRYGAKKRALWPERKKVDPFWKPYKRDYADNKSERERWRKDRELEKEKMALALELLGPDPEKQAKEAGMPEPGWAGPNDVRFLPEAKRDAVAAYLENFEDRRQEFNERNQGMWDFEARTEQKKLEAERLQGLAELLTPQEMREFELRGTQLAMQLGFELRDLSMTRDQYEAIYDIRKKYGESIHNYGDEPDQKAQQQKSEENRKAMQAEMAKALGPDLTKTYGRSQDWSYQQLNRLALRNDLPADTASKIYDFKDALEETRKQLMADTRLTEDQRKTAQMQVNEETIKTIKETLGPKAYERYLRNGGWWLNSLGPSASR